MRGVGVGKLWGVGFDLSFPTFTGIAAAEGTLIVCGSQLFAGRWLKAVSAVSYDEGHSGLSANGSATRVPETQKEEGNLTYRSRLTARRRRSFALGFQPVRGVVRAKASMTWARGSRAAVWVHP